jgi:hypothetical protein
MSKMTVEQLKIARIPVEDNPVGSKLMAEVCDTALSLYAENERLLRRKNYSTNTTNPITRRRTR